jgi:hypothetical protein
MTDLKTSDRDINRAIRSWLREDRHEDVSRVAGAVLDQVETIPQRHATWWPARRTELMNKIVGLGLAAAAVVVAVFVGAQLFGSSSGGLGSQPTPTPEPTATSEPTATPEPSPSPPASAPPLTQSFTSTLHGISVSYAEGWTAQAATEPWTDSTFPLEFGRPHADFLYDPTLRSDLFLTIASQPIGDSTPEDWVAEQMASDEGCTATEPIAVDGATALIGADECNVATVTTAGRGYWIQLYTGGDAPVTYDKAWFEEILATVQLDPEDAADSAASPSP